MRIFLDAMLACWMLLLWVVLLFAPPFSFLGTIPVSKRNVGL
jgi:hypothetical protein